VWQNNQMSETYDAGVSGGGHNGLIYTFAVTLRFGIVQVVEVNI